MSQDFVVDEDRIYATSEIIPKFYTGEDPDSTVKEVHTSKKDAEYYDLFYLLLFLFTLLPHLNNDI